MRPSYPAPGPSPVVSPPPRRYDWHVSTRRPEETGGLTAFDAAKIIGLIVAVVVVVAVVGKVVSAIMSLLWALLVGVAIIAAGWVLWSLVRGGRKA